MARSRTTYVALADELETGIASLAPGARLPSENELAEAHGVSRVTARSALRELEQRHAVRRTRGSGTYVALRIPYAIRAASPPSWSQLVRAAGHEPTYRRVSVELAPPPAPVAGALLIPPNETALRVERLGLVDGQVASFQRMWFPAALVPDLGRHLGRQTSVTGVLRDVYRLASERWWSQAELVPSPPEVAADLELVGRPLVWQVSSVNRCARRNVPIECSRGWMRADCFRVFLELGPNDGVAPGIAP
jgi:DNA-binding GntR family transcriptional regulator